MIKAEWTSNDALSAEQTTQTNAPNALNVMDCVSRQAAVSRISDLLMLELKGRRLPTWDEVNEAINELPSAQPEPRWIPVTERLPENFERVIVWMSWGGFSMMDFQLGHFYPLNSVHPVPDEAVTAWMPLPEPYREEATNAQLD